MAGSTADGDPSAAVISQLELKAVQLIVHSLAPSSQQVYVRALKAYALFHLSHFHNSQFLPISAHALILFLTDMHNRGFASSTIHTTFGSLSFFNKLLGVHHSDQSFLIKKLLAGLQRGSQPSFTRLPIHISLLHRMIDHILSTDCLPYSSLLLRSMFLLAFHALLRVGEFTVRNPSLAHATLQLADISFIHEQHSTVLQVTLRHFKGNIDLQPFRLVIPSSSVSAYCPVITLKSYLSIRGNYPGPLFLDDKGCPVSRHAFSTSLRNILTSLGITSSDYKPHSFRIGAATTACSLGIPDNLIQRMGRWKSDAFKRYIRLPQLSSHLSK